MIKLEIPSGFSNMSLKFGDHLCFLIENDEEQFYTSMPFIKAGIENNEKCIYIGDNDNCRKFGEFLENFDIDVIDIKKTGQLIIANYNDLFPLEGSFIPEKMLNLFKITIENIPDEGWQGLRIIQDMSWLADDPQLNDKLMEYESELRYNILEKSVIFLCQYDRRKFERETLVQILKLHNTVIVGDTIYKNQYLAGLNEVLPIQNNENTKKLKAQH